MDYTSSQTAENLQEFELQRNELVTQQRVDAFKSLIDYAEANGVSVPSDDWKRLSVWATSELGLTAHRTSDLVDLHVEPEKMKEYEYQRIIKRARTGLKQIIEERKKFYTKENPDGTKTTFGPFTSSRKLRRMVGKKLPSKRATSRSSLASKIVDDINSRRITI